MHLFKLFKCYSNHFLISLNISDFEILAREFLIWYAVVPDKTFQVPWIKISILHGDWWTRIQHPLQRKWEGKDKNGYVSADILCILASLRWQARWLLWYCSTSNFCVYKFLGSLAKLAKLLAALILLHFEFWLIPGFYGFGALDWWGVNDSSAPLNMSSTWQVLWHLCHS